MEILRCLWTLEKNTFFLTMLLYQTYLIFLMEDTKVKAFKKMLIFYRILVAKTTFKSKLFKIFFAITISSFSVIHIILNIQYKNIIFLLFIPFFLRLFFIYIQEKQYCRTVKCLTLFIAKGPFYWFCTKTTKKEKENIK